MLTDRPEVIHKALKGQFSLSSILREMTVGLRGTMKQLAVPRVERITMCGLMFTAVLTQDLEQGGYTVACKEIPAAISHGETIQEALENVTDAIKLCLEAEEELGTNRVQAR